MFAFLLTWYNLPFLIALGGCVLFALLQVAGGIGDHGGDAGIDTDADLDVDVDVDASLDVDHSLDLGGHAGHTLDPALADSGLLAMLGVRRVPLALVLMALLGSFGAFGLLGNTLLAQSFGGNRSIIFLVVLVVALVLALLFTSQISRLLGRVITENSTVVGFEQLIGRVGTVSSATISATYGRVNVRDSYGTIHTVYAVLPQGEPLPEQSEVALIAYDHEQRRFLARALNQRKTA